MPVQSVNGIDISFIDEGSGVPLLLAHAFPLAAAMWQPQIAALASRYRVIAPDLRGFGATAVLPGPSLMETMADDLAALLDALGIDQVTLGGLSMGGYIAFAFLRRHAHRLRALILADTRAAADTPEGKAGREINAQLVEREGVAALADKLLPNLLAPDAPGALLADLRVIAGANQPAGIAGALRGMALRPDASDLLPTIAVPTLLIVGTEDRVSPPDELRAMHDAISGSRYTAIPGAGHLSNIEQPEAFNAALLSFLADL